jgi:hypothetical protein
MPNTSPQKTGSKRKVSLQQKPEEENFLSTPFEMLEKLFPVKQ